MDKRIKSGTSSLQMTSECKLSIPGLDLIFPWIHVLKKSTFNVEFIEYISCKPTSLQQKEAIVRTPTQLNRIDSWFWNMLFKYFGEHIFVYLNALIPLNIITMCKFSFKQFKHQITTSVYHYQVCNHFQRDWKVQIEVNHVIPLNTLLFIHRCTEKTNPWKIHSKRTHKKKNSFKPKGQN